MTDIKFDSKLTTSASDALVDHARPLYNRLGATRVGIVELRSVEQTTPVADGGKSPGVKVRIIGLEIANKGEQEDAVRRAQQTLHLQRTAAGTLDEHGQIQLSERTLELVGEVLSDIENARLRAALERWTSAARSLAAAPWVADPKVRKELKRIADGLDKALHPARDEDDSDDVDGEG